MTTIMENGERERGNENCERERDNENCERERDNENCERERGNENCERERDNENCERERGNENCERERGNEIGEIEALEMEEERRVWRVNAPLIYDIAEFSTLDWPSLTVEWLMMPIECGTDEDNDCGAARLILGTHTDGDEINRLIVADCHLGERRSPGDTPASAGDKKAPLIGRLGSVQSLEHVGDVNRARAMPQDRSVIATRSSESDSFVYVVDRSSEWRVLTLRGHSAEGYGVSWSQLHPGRLLTAAFDRKICVWNIERESSPAVVTPTETVAGHDDKVEDVSWHPADAQLFASVGDDKRLLLWDCRAAAALQTHTIAHDDEANCVAWHPLVGHLLLTGGSDGFVNLWDRRKLVNPLHAFETEAPVYRTEWAPRQETLFLSSGLSSRIHIWDIAKIGDDVLSYEEEDRAPPELLMMHSGHAAPVTDIAWHPRLPWTVASVSEDNILNVWQMKSSIFD